MKKYFNSLLFAAAAIVSASCAKEQAPVAATTSLTINISDAGKTVWHDSKVTWASNDRIIAIDDEGTKHTSEKVGVSYAEVGGFVFNDWAEGRTPSYVLFNQSGSGKVCSDAGYAGGNLIAVLPSEQSIQNNTSFAQYACVGAGVVTGNATDGYQATLKNICGTIGFRFETESGISSLELSSLEGVDLAGKIAIPVSSLTDEPAYVVADGKKSITLSAVGSAADEDGCFKVSTEGSHSSYMAAVLPEVTFTPVLTFTKADGSVCMVKASKQITIGRNDRFNLDVIDSNLEFFKPELPDEITLDLNFYNEKDVNPLGTFKTTQSSEQPEWYDFNYKYTFKGSEFIYKAAFGICKGATDGAGYSYVTKSSGTPLAEGKVLRIAKSGAWIDLPAIEGRYLKSVAVTIGNTSAKSWAVVNDKGETLASSGSYKASGDAPATATVVFYGNVDPIQTGTSYRLQMTSAQTLNVYDITVVYAKTLPWKQLEAFDLDLTTISEGTFKCVNLEGSTVKLYARQSTPSDENKRKFDFWTEQDGKRYTFTSEEGAAACYWSALGMGKGYVRFPEVQGYRLAGITDFKMNNDKTVKWSVCTDTEGTVAVGGDEKSLTLASLDTPASWDISADTSGSYWLRNNASQARATFKLHYEPVSAE